MARPPSAQRSRRLVVAALLMLTASASGCTPAAQDAFIDETVRAPAPPTAPVHAASDAPHPAATPGVEALYDVSTASSITVVVTKRRPLDPLDYDPVDLVALDGVPGGGGQRLRAEAADALSVMATDAADAGAAFRVSTAYRSYGFQQSLYQGYVSQYGTASADRRSARPGYSEHQTGLALDVYDTPDHHLTSSFGDTAAGVWLAAHAYEYGFIVSYPEGYESVTGYVWEPWHLRYVGPDVAGAMHEAGIATLQEFMGVPAAPDYG